MQPADDTPQRWARAIRDAALQLGFVRVGFTPVEPSARDTQALQDWLAAGYHGDMAYMAGPRHAQQVLAEARTVVVVALPYPRGDAAPPPGLHGVVARYARGADYHEVLKRKLEALGEACCTIVGRPVRVRPCVDTAPLLERSYAAQAGVGFAAKSTMTIVPGVGTYVLLGELLLDVDLDPSEPARSRCGSCTACLDACPTGAFVGPHVLDARRCVSYLTIELRGPIPPALRPLMGNMVAGCDICQEVCPFNASPRPRPSAPELAARHDWTFPELQGLLLQGSAVHRRRVKGSALRRLSRQQLARNAAVALGNSGDPRAVPALAEAAQTHAHPLVRSHAAWALGQLGGAVAEAVLRQIAAQDGAPEVRDEAAQALHTLCTSR